VLRVNVAGTGLEWAATSGGTIDHAGLDHLAYADAGHTGFQAALTFGIADTNKVQINAADVAVNDYALFTATGLKGRSYAEVLSDIGAAPLASPSFTGTVTIVSGVLAGLPASESTYFMLAHKDYATSTGYAVLAGNNGYTFFNKRDLANTYIGFRVGNVDKMVISNSGNIGIGTTDPNAREVYSCLTISGTTATANNISVENEGTGQVGIILRRDGGTVSRWGIYTPSASTDLRFYSGSDLMMLTSSGSLQVVGEVTAYYSSDRRLKQNINYQFSGLDLIDRMRPATYNWNDVAKGLNSAKDNRRNYGMIADEIQNVTPELIHSIYEKYDAVDYVQVIPILVKAIQELREEVKQLRSCQ
jgi:hypothetical protein